MYKINPTTQKQATMKFSKAEGNYVTQEGDGDDDNKDSKDDDNIVDAVYAVAEADASPVSEIFSIPKDFVIKNEQWFGGGDAEITIPNTIGKPDEDDEVMYKMVCFDTELDAIGEFKTCKVVLKNRDGNSVLIITDYLVDGAVAMELFCPLDIHESDYATQLRTATPICRVSRKFNKFTIHNRYEIELLDTSAIQMALQNKYEAIDCEGHWPKKMQFVAHESRKELAFGERNFKNNWALHVEAGEDVLLFIGIACAIDRISYEYKMNHVI